MNMEENYGAPFYSMSQAFDQEIWPYFSLPSNQLIELSNKISVYYDLLKWKRKYLHNIVSEQNKTPPTKIFSPDTF